MSVIERTKQRRGFAAMSLEKRQTIARMGGSALTREQRSFARDNDLARRAAAKGGRRTRPLNEDDLKLMLEIAVDLKFEVPHDCTGRLKRKLEKLVKRGYVTEMAGLEVNYYLLTEAGRIALAEATEIKVL